VVAITVPWLCMCRYVVLNGKQRLMMPSDTELPTFEPVRLDPGSEVTSRLWPLVSLCFQRRTSRSVICEDIRFCFSAVVVCTFLQLLCKIISMLLHALCYLFHRCFPPQTADTQLTGLYSQTVTLHQIFAQCFTVIVHAFSALTLLGIRKSIWHVKKIEWWGL